MTQTADRYGKVLYDLRVPAEDVEQMKAALCAAPQLVKILNDPTLTKEVKHEIIETIFPKSLHNFLKTVSDRRRCDQIDDMLESYRACVRKEKGIVAATLYCVHEPDENQKAQMYLEMAKKEFSPNDIRIRKQKILVAALAGYIHDLDMVLNPPEEPEQLELPMFRNNDQRKEWLRNHRDWGVWYTDEHIGCTYYKYDFENGARLIAEEYESKYTDHVSYLHLINGPKVPRGKNGQTKWTIHDCYTKYPNSESELVEFLKWIQKGEK